jgi:hypothetical protein
VGDFGRKLRQLHRTSMSVSAVVGTSERTYQSNEDYPRRKHEYRENRRNERWWNLLLLAKGVFDTGLRMVIDFFRVWGNWL